MKTKLTLLLSALSLAAFAGPSDSTALGLKFAKENAAKSDQTAVARNDNTQTRLVPVNNGKGGIVMKQERVSATTNIALFKSSKGKCDEAACCAKR